MEEEDEARVAFEAEELKVSCTRGYFYLRGFCGEWEKLEMRIRPKVRECADNIETLRRFAVRYLQTAYAGL